MQKHIQGWSEHRMVFRTHLSSFEHTTLPETDILHYERRQGFSLPLQHTNISLYGCFGLQNPSLNYLYIDDE